MNSSESVIILKAFAPEHQQSAQALILAGLEEHWGTLDPAYNHDLHDIGHSYAAGRFLTAWLDDKLVGTGAFMPRDDATVEIVRMSVALAMRRKGIGRVILQALIDAARSDGYRRVILETTRTWQDAIAFYQSYGFQFTHYSGDDIYFALDLT